MDEEVKEEENQKDWEKEKSEREKKDEERTRKNREKREKLKRRKGKAGAANGVVTESKAGLKARLDVSTEDGKNGDRSEYGSGEVMQVEPQGLVIHDDD